MVMLKVSYGPDETEDPDQTCKAIRSLALIWSLRLLLAMGPTVPIDDSVREVLSLLNLADSEKDFRALLSDQESLRTKLKDLIKSDCPLECILSENLKYLQRTFLLDDVEIAVLACLSVSSRIRWFNSITCTAWAEGYLPDRARCIATVIKVSANDVRRVLSGSSRLCSFGILSPQDREGNDRIINLSPSLEDSILSRPLDTTYLLSLCTRSAPPADCHFEDFEPHRLGLDLIAPAVKGFVNSATNPAGQILIHGRPGTGKTEFTRALATHLGLRLREVTETWSDNSPMNPGERMQQYQLAQGLIAGQRDTLLLFDEADQVLSWSHHSSNRDREGWDKSWVNRTIEAARVPCIWIANDINQVHPAILRRFRIVQEMELLSPERLATVFRGQIGRLPVSDRWLHRVAETGQVTPALIKNAAQIAELAHPQSSPATTATLTGVLNGHCKAVSGRRLMIDQPEGDLGLPWQADWLSTEPGIDGIAELIGNPELDSIRLLFHGPPGTGKTALARELSHRLGRSLLSAPASRLLGPFLGETEQNIARLFDQAMRQNALLLLDEADSLLCSRESATQQWRVSQVNELLLQMEQYRGLFIAATNRLESLDPACLRRLDIKVKFDYLPSRTIRQMCRTVLDQRGRLGSRIEARINRLDCLTPGDFRIALKRLHITRARLNITNLIGALEAECRAKPEGRSQSIGFIA